MDLIAQLWCHLLPTAFALQKKNKNQRINVSLWTSCA